ncbi:MAG: ubiquinol oxidase subunit II [Phycisphaerales bacterium]|nr:ubiquinol oxidase subunit II [Phycisphaerales bacterium]
MDADHAGNPDLLPNETKPLKSRSLLRAVAMCCAVIMAPVVLSACQPAVLDPEGPVGLAVRSILIDSVAIMLAIVIPTIAAILAFAWWFRASNARAVYLPNWVYSGRIELVVWSIPLMVIMLLGGVAWIGSHDLDPAKPLSSAAPPVEVQVISMDWKWLFIYPDQGVASVNQLVIPAGAPIRFSLTSASVMNAFFIPRLGSMIYTMNGMTTQLNLQADTPGTLRGLSSQFSGDGFSDMHFEVLVLPQDRFDAWIEATRGAGPTLDPETYAALVKQSANVSPFTYRAAAPGLFRQIVAQKLPPGPGPRSGRPNPSVSPRMEE